MEKENNKHTQGKPWKIEAKFKSYEEAKEFCVELQKSENPPEQIKIKHLSSSNFFVVKTRKEKQKNNSLK